MPIHRFAESCGGGLTLGGPLFTHDPAQSASPFLLMTDSISIPMELLRSEADALAPQLVEWRRDFHRHPELGFRETRTAGIVARHLNELGLEVTTGVGGTGVVALIEGDNSPAEAPTVMLRCDMDALPIQEVARHDYASQTDGVMHACGHDGHTAIGMGVATLLARHRNALRGRVKLVFQPAEEGLGGARAMIADGVLSAPQPAASFGLHLWSRLPLNTIVVQEGPLFAAADVVNVTVYGQGGHGAIPQETVDATLIASHIVVALQAIVSRNLDPTEPAVVTVGSFQSGSAPNVIAARADLSLSIRSTSEATRDFLFQRISTISDGICAAFGARAECSLTFGVPATRNDDEGAALMRAVAVDLVGAEHVIRIRPMMVGEDMSEFLNRAPGCYVLVGGSDPDGPLHAPHHSDTFDFDERLLPTGVALLSATAMAWLEKHA